MADATTKAPITYESHAGDDIFRVCVEMQALADEQQNRVECSSFNEFRLCAKPGGDGVWLGINAFAGRLNRRDPAFAKSWHHPTDDDIVHVLTFSTAVMASRFLMDTALEKTDGDWGKAWDIGTRDVCAAILRDKGPVDLTVIEAQRCVNVVLSALRSCITQGENS